MMLCRIILLATALLYALGAAAQTTRVRGRVTDAADGHPLQFASVVFPGTTTGITTDEKGIYALETRDTSTRVQASIVGYTPATQTITPGAFNEVNFALQAMEFGIDQVVITPGDNPALPILREAIRRRAENDPEQYDTYRCRTYTKMELDLTNIRPGFRNKRLQRNFGFVFDYMDTSALTGQPYLPAMISESSADLYHSLSPSFTREVIRASRVSGVEDSFAVAQFTGGMHGDVNFYDHFIDLFDVHFAGPLGPGGTSFYNYFLVDSLTVDGRKTYKIRFHPRRLTSPVLDGELHIDSASYALRSASARMPRGVNVNWIRHLRLDNENSPTPDGRWFRDRDRVSAEFSLTTADSSKLVSFIGTREITYSDVHIGEPIPEEVLRTAELQKGLVLVTGPAGAGKSTTLACIVDRMNHGRSGHVVTMEDPIEFVHRHGTCIVTQREVPTDVATYDEALRSAMREAPDVILLGEMRDAGTISTAVTAAETAQLVFSTLHTTGAAGTVDRIVDAFPASQQRQIRLQLSMVLQVIVSQQLVSTVDGGVTPAWEIMVSTPAIRNLIREEKTHQIDSAIAAGGEQGMRTMDQSLFTLVESGRVARDVALQYAVHQEALERRLTAAGL